MWPVATRTKATSNPDTHRGPEKETFLSKHTSTRVSEKNTEKGAVSNTVQSSANEDTPPADNHIHGGITSQDDTSVQ